MSGGVGVTSIRSIEFGVPDLDAARTFYEDLWGLSVVDRKDDAVYLRASGPEHHVVVLHKFGEPRVLRVDLGAADRGAVDRIYGELESRRIKLGAPPAPWSEPGSGYGFEFADPEGRRYALVAGTDLHELIEGRPDVPVKLSHLVFNSKDADESSSFYETALGFRLRDRTSTVHFLGCNADHHGIGLASASTERIHHVAFDLPSIDALMRGAGRMKRRGLELEWGVGRHGPGDNVFAYYVDPFGLAVEYSTEMLQVDDATYRAGTPEDWDPTLHPGRWGTSGPRDQWGLANQPSALLRASFSGAR